MFSGKGVEGAKVGRLGGVSHGFSWLKNPHSRPPTITKPATQPKVDLYQAPDSVSATR
jgi:hypothetical protein